MTDKIVSQYAPNAVSGKKKHIYSRLLDYFLTLVASYIVFAIALPIASTTKLVGNMTNNISIVNKELNIFVETTHLERYNEDQSALEDVNTGAAKYVEIVAKTGAYVHDLAFPYKVDGEFIYKAVTIEETFINDASNYPLDNPSYYFRIYKATHDELNDYGDGKKYQDLTLDEIETYLYTTMMAINKSYFVESSDPDYIARGSAISKYNVLTIEATNALIKYYADDRNDLTVYNSVFNSYGKGIVTGIREVEAKSNEYKVIENRFNAFYQDFARFNIALFFISYFIAYILLNLIICLVKKEWVSIGQSVMGLGLTDKDEMEPVTWKMILYHLINLILFSTGSLLVFYLLGIFGATSLYVLPHISLLAILLFILTFNLVDLFMPIFSKKRNSILTFVLGLKLKDKKEFDVPVGADILDKKEDGKSEN